MAHEINNPLEIVYNYLKYIKYSFDDAKLHETVDELHEEITYIAGIVRDLLSLSGTAQVQREGIDINEMIRSTVGLLRHSAHEKLITMAFGSQERELTLTVNRNEIKQVILNLVKNSFEAMPGGGQISIETSRALDERGRPCASIVFSDTGPGIPDANLTNVFIPFYSTRKGKGDHVGLGLSICYGIIKRHDGSMSVRNLERAVPVHDSAAPHGGAGPGGGIEDGEKRRGESLDQGRRSASSSGYSLVLPEQLQDRLRLRVCLRQHGG